MDRKETDQNACKLGAGREPAMFDVWTRFEHDRPVKDGSFDTLAEAKAYAMGVERGASEFSGCLQALVLPGGVGPQMEDGDCINEVEQ